VLEATATPQRREELPEASARVSRVDV